MKTYQDHLRDQDLLQSLLSLVTVTQELSALEIKKLKDKIAHETEFFEELSQLHQIVHFKHHQHQPPKTPQELAIFISTQTQFTGSIHNQIFDLFLDFVKSNPNLSLVILSGHEPEVYHRPELKQAHYLQLPPDPTAFTLPADILQLCLSATHIHFFRSLFISLGNQKATHHQFLDPNTTLSEHAPQYLLEPDSSAVLDFFNNQIFLDHLVHLIKQSNLATHGVRFLQLDEAGQQIKKSLSKTGDLLHLAKSRLENNNQVTRIARLMALSRAS